ncbi:unnamed protein product [Moneuplotes crassus]|uniref:Uncharacterized protein n=1 Tax=Euplotes crassus TaxID=5936 RepID=A0AAD1UJP8_EUPCR|nr:unnamed protein product [Moneuplotes crassus]
MFNAFVVRKGNKRSATTEQSKKKVREKLRKIKQNQYAERANIRADAWVRMVSQEPAFRNTYHKGSFPLKNEKDHVFKDIDPRSKLKKKDFYNYTYRPDHQKAEEACKANNERILNKNIYSYTDMSKDWLRKRTSNKEIQQVFKFKGYKSDNERLKWHRFRDIPTDTVVIPMKNKFYIDPKWKTTTPKKWVSDKIFKTGKSTTWKKALTNCNDEIYDPYIDGFDVTGDVKIKRKKQDDVSKNVFSSTVRPHPYSEDQLFTTKTIRSFKSVQGAFSCTNPGMIRSRSIADFRETKIPMQRRSSEGFLLKIAASDTKSDASPVIRRKDAKVLEVEIDDIETQDLYELENMRFTQTQDIRIPGKQISATKNKNFVESKDINDKYVLASLSKSKMYYKSVQGRMVSPKVQKGKSSTARRPLENYRYKGNSMDTISRLVPHSSKRSASSLEDIPQ